MSHDIPVFSCFCCLSRLDFLCFGSLWSLLVCVPKVIFLPPTPTGTFLPVSTLPPQSSLAFLSPVQMYTESLAQNWSQSRSKTRAGFGAQLWGRRRRKNRVEALSLLPLLSISVFVNLHLGVFCKTAIVFDVVSALSFSRYATVQKMTQSIWIIWPSSSLLWNWHVPPSTSPCCLFVLSVCVPVAHDQSSSVCLSVSTNT